MALVFVHDLCLGGNFVLVLGYIHIGNRSLGMILKVKTVKTYGRIVANIFIYDQFCVSTLFRVKVGAAESFGCVLRRGQKL